MAADRGALGIEPRHAVPKDRHIRRGAADVDDHRIPPSRQEAGAHEAGGGPGENGLDRSGGGQTGGDERAVALHHHQRGQDAPLRQQAPDRQDQAADLRDQPGVEERRDGPAGRVEPRRQLVGGGAGEPGKLSCERRHRQLVGRIADGEAADDGQRLDGWGELADRLRRSRAVEGRPLAPGRFVAAGNQPHRIAAERHFEPAALEQIGSSADQQQAHGGAPALDQGVGGERGRDSDEGQVDRRAGEDLGHRITDALGEVAVRRQRLGGPDDAPLIVEQDGIGVGPAGVDAERKAQARRPLGRQGPAKRLEAGGRRFRPPGRPGEAQPMLYALRANWALFIGILVLMLGHGLQGSLTGVRAAMADFPTAVTGIVMSGYYIGFLGGSTLVPALIRRVGHVRVFAALSSLASCTILVQSVEVDPVTWFLMRFGTGVALCGIFLTAESWLNSKATNEFRGQILSAYMVIQLGGVAGGQFLLNLASPGGFQLFVLVSVLLSLGVIPMLLTATPAPTISASRRVGLRELYRSSPLGAMAIFSIGVAQGGLYGIGPVYARNIGLSVAGISLFMALAVLGGMLFQWPLGVLSDRFDRRRVIAVTTFLAALVGFAAAFASGTPPWPLFVLFFLWAGLSLPMYSMCVAHANDFMTPDQMVGASGALLLANGAGAILGPILSSSIMQAIGPWGFPLFIGAIHALIGVFALWRMTRRAAKPLALQGPTITVSSSATPVATAIAQEAAVAQSPSEIRGERQSVESPA